MGIESHRKIGLLIVLALMAAVALQAANDSIKQRILDSYVRYGREIYWLQVGVAKCNTFCRVQDKRQSHPL